MRSFLIAIVCFLNGGVILAQLPNKSVKVEALRALIGDESQNAGVSFLGDEIRPYLNGSKKGLKSWGRVNRKTDIFVVFSKETKALVQKKSKKTVVVGDSIEAYFTRTWRGQGFYTWIDLQGDKVAFVETSPKPADPKVKWVQGAEDTLLAEYITNLTDSKKRVEVLVVGTKVTESMMDTLDLSNEFSALKKRLTHVIVYSEEVRKVLASQTNLPIVVTNNKLEQGSAVGRMKWTIVEAKGSELIRVRASSFLNQIITPRSERDKPPK